MWTLTNTGFFSAVEHRDDPSLLMVRCRAEDDARYIARKTGAKIIRSKGLADYEFRITITRAQYAAFVVQEILGIDYANFKDSVKKRQGPKRAGIYMRVWSALVDLQPMRPYANVPLPALPTGPRGGRIEYWWDNIVSDEDAGAAAASVSDEPDFWNCRDCGKDIVDCTCNPATRTPHSRRCTCQVKPGTIRLREMGGDCK